MSQMEGPLIDAAPAVDGPGARVVLALDGAVAIVTLDDPAGRNSLRDETLRELSRHLSELDRDPAVRCIVISGSDRVFASGADIRALLDRSAREIHESDRARCWETLRAVRTPLVAAVSGFCLGGGCELALTADIVIASETARFGLPETGLGLIPGAGGTQLLPRAIGKAKAMDLVLTGRLLDAHEAERAGLVSRVVGAGDWLTVALSVAAEIAARPPLAQRLAKEAVAGAGEMALSAGIDAERRAFMTAFGDPDAREGMSAFLEKRPPRWSHGDLDDPDGSAG
jgi:enoyl-CoA hydratase